MTLALGIVIGAICGLLILSAFFASSQTALRTASRTRMHELARKGDRRAQACNRLLESPGSLVGAILLGSTAANILASALATAVLMSFFGDAGVAYAALAMTVLVLVFGEVLPRTFAVLAPERLALMAAPAISAVVAVLAPLTTGVEWIVKRTLGLFGADVSRADNVLVTHDELRDVIALRHKEGAVVKQDRDMLGGILDLSELELFDVMVHRTKMVTVDAAKPQKEIIEEVLRSGHTRLPVWKDQPDNIVGVLNAKDLLAALLSADGDTGRIDIQALCAPPWFVPDTTAVADQLSAFLRRKMHFALVVDEYGEVMGLVTLEDILEEIVGDITDEHDVAVAGVRREASGSYVVDGTVPVRDLNRLTDWRLPDDEATTVAGLVIHEARMIPGNGQAFTFHGFRFEVLRKRRHQLTSIRVTPLAKA